MSIASLADSCSCSIWRPAVSGRGKAESSFIFKRAYSSKWWRVPPNINWASYAEFTYVDWPLDNFKSLISVLLSGAMKIMGWEDHGFIIRQIKVWILATTVLILWSWATILNLCFLNCKMEKIIPISQTSKNYPMCKTSSVSIHSIHLLNVILSSHPEGLSTLPRK